MEEDLNKTSKKTGILIIIGMVIIISLITYFLFFNKNNLSKNNNDNSSIINDSNEIKLINLTNEPDEVIQNLIYPKYNTVYPEFMWEYTNITVDDLERDLKMLTVSNEVERIEISEEEWYELGYSSYVTEEDFKNMYYKVFGPDTEYVVGEYYGVCGHLNNYDETKKYITVNIVVLMEDLFP